MQLCHGEAMDETIAIVQEEGILDMVANSGPVVTAVLIILVLLSLWSWTITIAKLLQFRKAKKETEAFSQIFWESRNLSQIDGATRRLLSTPLSHVFNSGYKTLGDLIKEREEREEREAGVLVLERSIFYRCRLIELRLKRVCVLKKGLPS